MSGDARGGARRARVAHALRDVLQHAITNDVKDRRVRDATLITVARVELNVDLSVARVYVSIVGDDPDGVVEGLSKAAGFLRGPIGRELSLQHAPELRFFHDLTLDVSEKLAAIVRDDEERARAAGRFESVPVAAAAPTSEPALVGDETSMATDVADAPVQTLPGAATEPAADEEPS